MEHLGVLVEKIGIGGSHMMMEELEQGSGDREWMPLAKLRDMITETLNDVARGEKPVEEAQLLARRALPVLEERIKWYAELKAWAMFRLARASSGDHMRGMVQKLEEHARTAREIVEKLEPYKPQEA